MIAAAAVGSESDFEDLLDESVLDLKTTLLVGTSMSNAEFEDSVLKAMRNRAIGTVFENEIKKTGDHMFPDIVAQDCYGVEVKQTTKDGWVTFGNSIFESTRASDIQKVYLVMAKTGGDPDCLWKPYETVLADIRVTHSPRYVIDASGDGTVFGRMGIGYDEFSKLPKEQKMLRVRKLYEDKPAVWWLMSEKSGNPNYVLRSALDSKEERALRAEIMFLCPEIFGKARGKYFKAAIYALSQGVLVHNMRDLFTASGKFKHKGKPYSKIYETAMDLYPLMLERAKDTDSETLESFWERDTIPDNFNGRLKLWLDLVNVYNKELKEFIESEVM